MYQRVNGKTGVQSETRIKFNREKGNSVSEQYSINNENTMMSMSNPLENEDL